MKPLYISIDSSDLTPINCASPHPADPPHKDEEEASPEEGLGSGKTDGDNRDFIDGVNAQNLPHLDFHKRQSRNHRLLSALLLLYLLLIILMFGHLG